jgi:murein DD-endopeptidase MepM/ murein hydrolase activator NlpD
MLEIEQGYNLVALLESVGISHEDAIKAVEELGNIYNPNAIPLGQKIKVNFEIMDTEGKEINFSSMEMKISKSQKARVAKLGDDVFFSHVFESKVQPKLIYIHATVGATLFSAAMNAGLSHEMFNELVKAYSYDVDFQRDVVRGNEMEVLYEAIYDDEGKLISNGDILYTSLKIDRGKFTIYRYTTPDGKTDYYNDEGDSVQKSLLRTPVNGARISSGYGSRKHPILGFNKMHKGIDFAAPTGTPVYAAGDGIVIEMKRKGSYGKYIKIFHNAKYSTAYAHLNSFANRLSRGAKVNQGQVVGYVGSTGRSTGPHLHYEVIEGGTHVNPLSIKSGAGKKLTSDEKSAFAKYQNYLRSAAARMSAKSHEAKN